MRDKRFDRFLDIFREEEGRPTMAEIDALEEFLDKKEKQRKSPNLTVSQLVATDGSKNLTSITDSTINENTNTITNQQIAELIREAISDLSSVAPTTTITGTGTNSDNLIWQSSTEYFSSVNPITTEDENLSTLYPETTIEYTTVGPINIVPSISSGYSISSNYPSFIYDPGANGNNE